MRRRMIVLAVSAVVLASAGGAAFGYQRAHRIVEPNANGIITACYDTGTGKPRMVNAGARCARGEKKLTWRQHPPRPVVHVVGTAGEPAYATGLSDWKAYGGPPYGDLSFYRDASGVVHLTGLACPTGDGTTCADGTLIGGTLPVFTLPPGFRPAHQQVFTTLSYGLGTYDHIRLDVTTTGVVEMVAPPNAGEAFVSFDGISFLAG